jgi:hypothetical protein
MHLTWILIRTWTFETYFHLLSFWKHLYVFASCFPPASSLRRLLKVFMIFAVWFFVQEFLLSLSSLFRYEEIVSFDSKLTQGSFAIITSL